MTNLPGSEASDESSRTVRFQMSQFVDPTSNFDCWILSWCLVSDRLLALRRIFLRMGLDVGDLNARHENRYRSLMFELHTAFVREGKRLADARSHFQAELANAPAEIAQLVDDAFDEFDRLMDAAAGSKKVSGRVRNLRNRSVHPPVDYNEDSGGPPTPQPVLKEGLAWMDQHNSDQSFEMGPRIADWDLTFVDALRQAMTVVDLGLKTHKLEDSEFEETHRAFFIGARDVMSAMDQIATTLCLLLAERKGLVHVANGSS